jgi:Uma2 family endonuclease
MSVPVATGYTYADLERFPEDGTRREVIGGDLYVTSAPAPRHQRVVVKITLALGAYEQEHGGSVFTGPIDVYFSERDIVEPDVIFVAAGRVDILEERFVRGAPDLIVEVSSPSTRRLDVGRKRDMYERNRVAEYWFVDLDTEVVEVHTLHEGRYEATRCASGDTIASRALWGLRLPVDEIFFDHL